MKQIFNLLPNQVYRIKSKISVTAIEIHIVRLETHKEYNSVMNGASYVKYTHHRKKYVARVIDNTFKSPDFKIYDKNAFFITPDVDIYGTDSPSMVEIESGSLLCGKKKICYIVSNSCIGGVEKIILNLLKMLDRQKYYVCIIVTELKGVLHELYEEYSDECYLIINKGELNNFFDNRSFDVCHIFNSILGMEILKKKMKPAKVVMSMFGDYSWPGMWYSQRIELFMRNIEYIDVITTDNPKNVELFKNFPVFIPNGVIVSQKKYMKNTNKPIILWIGRNSGEKRPGIVYNTAKSCPELDFFVAISNPLSKKSTYGLESLPNATLLMDANEKMICSLCERSMVFFNTSLTEGMPVALLEAMSKGCIPVVPNVGNMLQLVEDVGIVVDDLDETDYGMYIKKAVEIYQKNPSICEKIVEKIYKSHNIDVFNRTVLDVYEGRMDGKDKTGILKKAGKIVFIGIEDRLKTFMSEKPWEIEKNIDFAMKFYRAVFDVNLESNPFWPNVIKKGYPRKKFTYSLTEFANNLYPEYSTLIGEFQNDILDRLGEYPDDVESYIPNSGFDGRRIY